MPEIIISSIGKIKKYRLLNLNILRSYTQFDFIITIVRRLIIEYLTCFSKLKTET